MSGRFYLWVICFSLTNLVHAHADQVEGAGALETNFRISTGIHALDNLDFRPLDESSDRAIIDSDDRRNFGHSDIQARIGYQAHPDARIDATLRYDVLWRDDQLGRSHGSTGDLNFFELALSQRLFKAGDFDGELRMGRQPFQIGGGVPRDYILAGTLDAITLNVSLGAFGGLRILALDFFGGNALPENGYRFYRDGRRTTYNLRGETNTFRSGLVYTYGDLKKKTLPVTASAYYFYATIAGGPIEESGSDITYGGALGNYRDRDYQHLAGVRIAYAPALGRHLGLHAFGELAHSEGIDRKPAVERDVNTSGNAMGAGLMLNWRRGDHFTLAAGGDFYHFDGGNYASDGLEFERGFVGFKGERIGGNTVGRYLAWRPSSHVDASGVVHAPHDKARVSGTQFIHGALNLSYADTRLDLDFWFLKDTSSTFLNLANLESIPEPVFGFTRAEFAAQSRLGRDLGQAIDVTITHSFNQVFTLAGTAGVFLPGDFYAIEVDRLAGDQNTSLGGQETLWAGSLVGQVIF